MKKEIILNPAFTFTASSLRRTAYTVTLMATGNVF